VTNPNESTGKVWETKNQSLSGGLVAFIVLNAIFNNISVISCQSVLLVEKTGVPGEDH
jgi:hypothetical protein